MSILDFRRIEFLTIDDASNNNEIFEISIDVILVLMMVTMVI